MRNNDATMLIFDYYTGLQKWVLRAELKRKSNTLSACLYVCLSIIRFIIIIIIFVSHFICSQSIIILKYSALQRSHSILVCGAGIYRVVL